jgi:hypothetical protein
MDLFRILVHVIWSEPACRSLRWLHVDASGSIHQQQLARGYVS